MKDANIEGFQLSPQQRHLWRLAQDHDGPSPYVAWSAVRISGPVDPTLLRAVLQKLPARHEVLRTEFYASEEMPVPLQVIAPSTTPLEVREEDLSGASSEERAGALDRVAAHLDETLGRNPLRPAAVALVKLAEREYLLGLALPGLRCDGAGLRNLVGDIAAEYGASARNAVRAGEGPLQYPDAAIWLNDLLTSDEAEPGRRFWEQRDSGAAQNARLPFERADASESAFLPRRAPVRFAPESLRAALSISSAADLPPETFLLACWQILLQRTIGSHELVLGYAADGRSYAEVADAIGLFARTLPLSGELPEDTPFIDAAHRLAAAVREVTTWTECFDTALLNRTAGRPVFLPLVFERLPRLPRRVEADVEFAIEDARACVDRFRLKLACRADATEFGEAWIEYDGAIFREEDVVRLAAQLECLFASAAADPVSPLNALRLLPEEQERTILALCGGCGEASDTPVHRRFEAQAARIPQTTAVVCEEAALSYAELNARANRLAHHLQTRGVGPDVLVGLCLERSIDLAVGLLGILKAGGAYVPLDPALPPARLAAMLGQSRARLVVARPSLAALLPSSIESIAVDDTRMLSEYPSTNPTTAAAPDNLAYVLFTSGSTGRPKGVAIEHRQLASYVESVCGRLEAPPGASFATVTTFAADLGNTAIYPALAGGGCLHILTEARAADPNAFGDYMERHGIDVLKIVPSHLKALLTVASPARMLPRLRLVLGGEACPQALVDDIRRLAPHCVLFNHYGPTEATVGATMYRIPDRGCHPLAVGVPIGKPLAHARTYVVDGQMHLVPAWVAGELCIGGAGVARGYLSDTEMTWQKFVRDPWAGRPDARMYRTGDRVRMLPDGNLEFLGRADTQVKIRGYRVEIGEVEAALRRHPRFRDVVVLAQERDGGTQLAAFIVRGPEQSPSAAEIRSFLADQGLPDYMIPASLVGLDVLPLTPNGKVDRQALVAALERDQESGGAGEPLNEWESLIAGIWQELLGIDHVQPRDNFFDLGGHSLMAIQVVTALERRAGVQLNPRDLVFHTLRQFAALCASKSADAITR